MLVLATILNQLLVRSLYMHLQANRQGFKKRLKSTSTYNQQYSFPLKINYQSSKYRYHHVPERDQGREDYQLTRKQKIIENKKLNNHLNVYDMEQYVQMQGKLTKQLQLIMESIIISKEKSRLKDKQVQVIGQSMNKVAQKISKLQQSIVNKQKKLNKVSLKCHDLTQVVSKEQDKIKKEAILLHEETYRCNTLEEDIAMLEEKIKDKNKELERKKKIQQSIEEAQEQNDKLREKVDQLQGQEKMLQYRQNNDKKECQQLKNKIQQLQDVINERSKINRRNMSKLNALKKELASQQDSNLIKIAKEQEINSLELEVGQLSQQLLLANQEVSEMQFKIKKKSKIIKELKDKLASNRVDIATESYHLRQRKIQTVQILQSQQDQDEGMKSGRRTNNTQKVQLSLNSRNGSPVRNRSNQTPTFLSNELNLVSECTTANNNIKSIDESNNTNQAFRNIEKLINRFQQIKNKEKPKPL